MIAGCCSLSCSRALLSQFDADTQCVMCSAQLAVTLHSPTSGRYMDLYTNMPGLQLYSGNNLNGSTVGKGAHPYPVYGGMALETQVSSSIWQPWHCLVLRNWPWVNYVHMASEFLDSYGIDAEVECSRLIWHQQICLDAASGSGCASHGDSQSILPR